MHESVFMLWSQKIIDGINTGSQTLGVEGIGFFLSIGTRIVITDCSDKYFLSVADVPDIARLPMHLMSDA